MLDILISLYFLTYLVAIKLNVWRSNLPSFLDLAPTVFNSAFSTSFATTKLTVSLVFSAVASTIWWIFFFIIHESVTLHWNRILSSLDEWFQSTWELKLFLEFDKFDETFCSCWHKVNFQCLHKLQICFKYHISKIFRGWKGKVG